MDKKISKKIQVYVALSGLSSDIVEGDENSANHPVRRRLNRIERVIAAHQGVVYERLRYGLKVTFNSADTALLAACEMQNRCSSLPQQFKRHIALRIGLHIKVEKDSASEESAEELAVLDNGIIVSEEVVSEMNPELHALVSPLKAPSLNIPVFSIDWQLEIPLGVLNDEPLKATQDDGASTASKVFLALRYKEKTIELTRDIPVATFGRDPQNDLVFENDYLVSRNHCRIEWRSGRIVLTDTSTNGTSVTDEHGKEILIRKSSMEIHGKGLILLGRTFPGDLVGGIHYETF